MVINARAANKWLQLHDCAVLCYDCSVAKLVEAKLADNDDQFAKMIKANIEMANKHADIMDAMPPAEARQWLKNLIDANHVVWGVWNDPVKVVDMFPLKGDALLRASADASPPINLKMTAILCTPEQGKRAMLEARPDEKQ